MISPCVIAVIQARMGSTRLPGKVLLDIAGEPMLARVLARTLRADTVEQVIVATTTEASDDPVAAWCKANSIHCSRGSQHDVLDRYYQAALPARADVVVRITGDCPVIDSALIDECVETLLKKSFDFTCNRLPPPFTRTYPIGLDTEVCTFRALEQAWNEATESFHREHVMPFLYEGVVLKAVNDQLSEGISLRNYKVAQLHHKPDHGQMRWTVDTSEDLEFIRQVYTRFDGKDDFSWQDVLTLVQSDPDLAAINAAVRHKTLYDK